MYKVLIERLEFVSYLTARIDRKIVPDVVAALTAASTREKRMREALEPCLEHCMLEWTSDDPRAVRARAALQNTGVAGEEQGDASTARTPPSD